jgi:hypothetical protein
VLGQTEDEAGVMLSEAKHLPTPRRCLASLRMTDSVSSNVALQ